MRKILSMISTAALACGALVLGACVAQRQTPPATALSAEAIGLSEATRPADWWPAANWWSTYDDPQLTGLIEAAQRGSPSMRLVEARVRISEAARRATNAARFPSAELNAEVLRQHLSENYIYPPPLGGSVITDARGAIDFSYEFDLWGRVKAATAAADLDVAASAAERDLAHLILAVAVSRSYFSLQRAFEERNIARDTLDQREQLVSLLNSRVKRGLDDHADLESQKALLAEARRVLSAATQSITEIEHQLAQLTARDPGAFADLQPQPVDRSVREDLPTAIPADLLGRRADIVSMRLRAEAAARNIDAARADFYPNVNLTAFVGLQSISTSEFFEGGSRMFGAGPALHLPIFQRRQLYAQLDAREAQYDMAVEQYNLTVLFAVREVADYSSALSSLNEQRRAAEEGLAAQQRAYDLGLVRFKRGLDSFLPVITAQQSLLSQRRAVVDLRDRELQNSLQLIRALGGGYITSGTGTTRLTGTP